jgi:hypothetical protein
MHILFIFSTPQRCADRSVQCNMDLLRIVVCRRWLEECFRLTADFYGYARAPSDVRKESRWSWTQEGLERSLKFGRAQASTTSATVSELVHLDPDACFRKTTSTSTGSPFLKLAVLDSEDERDLLLDVWRYVRSGDLQVKIHSVVFLFLLFFFFFFFFFFKILMIISSFVFVCVYTSSTPTSSIPHLFSSLYSIHHSI